jgi:polyisoprenoid-binding protein YceI
MKKILGILAISLSLAACAAKTTPVPVEPQNTEDYSAGSIIKTTTETEHDSSYELDTTASTLGWEASRVAAAPHVGTVAMTSGTLLLNKGNFVGGEFVIDMTQITEEKNSERFLGHIKNDDFFSVEKFPTSHLSITSFTKLNETEYEVTGNLTIKDQTHPITFTAQMQETEASLTSTAEFQIDRTKWNITYDSGSLFQQLGDKAIKDEITYRLNLVFKK